MKTNKVINWDEYFMALSKLSALRSKDPNTQVGACIVNAKRRVIGLGYNGMPLGNDKDFPWAREGNTADTKYPYVIHAEINAILNTVTSIDGATLYTSLFPCSNCAKTIAQSGITTLVYEQDIYHDTEDAEISRMILLKTGIKTKKIDSPKIILEI